MRAFQRTSPLSSVEPVAVGFQDRHRPRAIHRPHLHEPVIAAEGNSRGQPRLPQKSQEPSRLETRGGSPNNHPTVRPETRGQRTLFQRLTSCIGDCTEHRPDLAGVFGGFSGQGQHIVSIKHC